MRDAALRPSNLEQSISREEAPTAAALARSARRRG